MALKVKEQELPWDINYGCVCIVETDVGSTLTTINHIYDKNLPNMYKIICANQLHIIKK